MKPYISTAFHKLQIIMFCERILALTAQELESQNKEARCPL